MRTKYLIVMNTAISIQSTSVKDDDVKSTFDFMAKPAIAMANMDVAKDSHPNNMSKYLPKDDYQIFSYPNFKEVDKDSIFNSYKGNVFVIKTNEYVDNDIDLELIINVHKANLLKNMTEDIIHDTEDNKNSVFIVHGHDTTAKVEAARFVEKLGFNAVILHEQDSQSMTIIEKLEHYSNSGFGVVLYTSCDVGGINVDSLEPRARQNVVFEHGYLMAKLGRPNVIALKKGNVDVPGDLSGVVYEEMDDNGAWKLKLAKELMIAGFDVDLSRL